MSQAKQPLDAASVRLDVSRNGGFLYIEVLVCLVILGTALLAIVPLFVLSAKENAVASDLTFSMAATQSKAEELKWLSYSALSSGNDVLKLRSMNFDRTWTVTVDSCTPTDRPCSAGFHCAARASFPCSCFRKRNRRNFGSPSFSKPWWRAQPFQWV